MTRFSLIVLIGCTLAIPMTGTASAQSSTEASLVAAADGQPGAAAQTTLEGTVVSSSRSTVIIRGKDGQARLFVIDRDTVRPSTIPPGATVSIVSKPGADPNAPVAVTITVTAQPPKPGEAPAEAAPAEPIPPAMRRLEQNIIQQTRKYRMGVHVGAGLDPEIVIIGVQAEFGPFFNERVSARPNVQFGFGEVTDFMGLNFEGVYRLGQEVRNWRIYFGGGPAVNFTKLGFDVPVDPDEDEPADGDETNDDDGFDFDDFELDAGLNFVAGAQSRNGMFVEVRASAYSRPTLRFAVGFNF